MNERILFVKLEPKTESDVIRWMKSLPPRTVNKTVNEIVVAESKGQTARIPYKISYTKEVEPLRCRLIFRSKSALNFLSKNPKGEYKATLVKIIRRHIEKNKGLPPVTFEINIKYLSMAVDCFIKAIKNKRFESKGAPHRFNKLNKFYEVAFRGFSDAVLNCYKSADRNHGDYNLYHLNCEYIVNKAFASVFGEISVTANKAVDQNSVKVPDKVGPNSADKNQEDVLLKILEYGIPDEELAIIYEKLNEVKSDEEKFFKHRKQGIREHR